MQRAGIAVGGGARFLINDLDADVLFGQQQEGIKKSELIVLITPQIIDPEKPNAEGLERTRQMEDKLKKEPQSLPGRLLQKFP